MAPDDFQKAWQAQSSQTRVLIDADLLLKEVQRSQRNFQAVIFWRDVSEVAVALLLIPIWFYLGAVTDSPWTWYLTVPVLVWMAAFMLIYRRKHKLKQTEPGEPLIHCVQDSVYEVESQIWLLRNIFWWYLLPPSISISAFFVHSGWLSREGGWLSAFFFVFFGIGILAIIYTSIYFQNQKAVRLKLEPRRRELLSLLANLQEESTGDGADDPISLPGLPFTEESFQASCGSPVRLAIGLIGFVLILGFLGYAIDYAIDNNFSQQTDEDYPKRSPFAAVRWQESQPEVKLDDEWFKLVSLNELPVSEILAFSQQTYGDLWIKRFEEDLVEILTRMGHPPRKTVKLVLQPLTSTEPQVRENVPMTEANRQAIREAARNGKSNEQK